MCWCSSVPSDVMAIGHSFIYPRCHFNCLDYCRIANRHHRDSGIPQGLMLTHFLITSPAYAFTHAFVVS